MKLSYLIVNIVGVLYLIQLSILIVNCQDDADYTDPNENVERNENGNDIEYSSSMSTSTSTSLPSSTITVLKGEGEGEGTNNNLEDNNAIINDEPNTTIHSNSSDIPLPIIIVFIFMFTMLGVICLQQLQRMFAENKEYNDIKFDIRENRATSRSGKTYGTVEEENDNNNSNNNNNNNNKKKRKNKRKNKNSNKNDKQTQISNSSNSSSSSSEYYQQNSTVVTVYSDTDEKVDEKINNKNTKYSKYSLSKYKIVGEEQESSSDECVELGSGYDTANQNTNINTNTNTNTNSNNSNKNVNNIKQETQNIEKIKQQMKVATQGLKDKIEKKLHGTKLNSKKNKYKGYGTLKQTTNNNDNNSNDDDNSDSNDTNDTNNNNDNNTETKTLKTRNLDSIDDDNKHADYGMNYGYSEDYDCDFEDSDTQLSDDCCDDTIVKRVALP